MLYRLHTFRKGKLLTAATIQRWLEKAQMMLAHIKHPLEEGELATQLPRLQPLDYYM